MYDVFSNNLSSYGGHPIVCPVFTSINKINTTTPRKYPPVFLFYRTHRFTIYSVVTLDFFCRLVKYYTIFRTICYVLFLNLASVFTFCCKVSEMTNKRRSFYTLILNKNSSIYIHKKTHPSLTYLLRFSNTNSFCIQELFMKIVNTCYMTRFAWLEIHYRQIC